MSLENMVSVVSFLVVIIGCGIGISGYMSKAKSEAEDFGEMKGLLDNIVDGVDYIKKEQKSLQCTLAKLSDRISTLEASNKAAHKRIDRLE